MPQPIDMQTELARTSMAERVQETVGRASLAAHQRSATDAEADRVNTETVVHETPESEASRVAEEGKRKNPYAKIRKKRRKKKGPSEAETKEFYSPSEGKTAISENPDDHQLDIEI